MDAAAWSAVAAWATFAIAVVGAIFGAKQVRLAAEDRRDRQRPAVTVDLVVRDDVGGIVYIEVANIGQTLARDVALSFDPSLPDGGDIADEYTRQFLSKTIPSMPPGKRHRTIFTHLPDRDPDWPTIFTVTVSCKDSRGRAQPPETYVLDLDVIASRMTIDRHGPHEINKTLKDTIAPLLRRIAQGLERRD